MVKMVTKWLQRSWCHIHDDDDGDDDDLRGIIEGRSLKAWGSPCSNALTSHSLGLRWLWLQRCCWARWRGRSILALPNSTISSNAEDVRFNWNKFGLWDFFWLKHNRHLPYCRIFSYLRCVSEFYLRCIEGKDCSKRFRAWCVMRKMKVSAHQWGPFYPNRPNYYWATATLHIIVTITNTIIVTTIIITLINPINTVICSRLTNNQMLWSFQHLVNRKPRLSWFHSWGWR